MPPSAATVLAVSRGALAVEVGADDARPEAGEHLGGGPADAEDRLALGGDLVSAKKISTSPPDGPAA